MSHPAPYSPEVLAALRPHLALYSEGLAPRPRIHDPFAGEGQRLGALADEVGVTFSGTELEAPFIIDPRVRQGDSTNRATYPRTRYAIVTSPVYPNGMADDFNAQDSSTRRTYRAARAKITGADQPLHPNNQGRWGYRGTPLHSPARAVYWSLAGKVIACWSRADLVLVNVSDFYVGDRREPVVAGWRRALTEGGFEVMAEQEVRTRRWKNGANRENRAEAEVILIARPTHGPSGH